MKISSLTLPASALALLAAALLAAAAVAQAPQTAPIQPPAPASPPAADHDHEHHPAPTNLKVLPKNLTGDQVHEIMEGWATALGTHCSNCHAADPGKLGPNGRPQLNFADDSLPAKSTARLMFKMVDNINENYISMVDNSGAPVTCGTCHRGHASPEPFVAPPKNSVPPPNPAEKAPPAK